MISGTPTASTVKDKNGVDVVQGDKVHELVYEKNKDLTVVALSVPGTTYNLFAFDGKSAYYALDFLGPTFTKV